MAIFVSVAAYRDLDLGATLLDCVAKARHPADLHFGVVWQYEDGEPEPPDVAPATLSLLKVHWRDSGGACWARAEAMKLWNGEEFFLQIDSHHRFIDGWDATLMEQAERTGASMPILSNYGTPFTPGEPLTPQKCLSTLRVEGFMREGVLTYGWADRPDWRPEDGPKRTRGVSGHLLFTLGRFVSDVPYDPELYFLGEEVHLAVRAFTWGYSLYSPSIPVLWHQFPRRRTSSHWDDHQTRNKVARTGRERDAASLERVRRFLVDPHIGPLGCGTARTVAEYERFAGVDFRRRWTSPEALRGDEPPPPPSPIEGLGGLRSWTVRCELDRASMPDAAFDRPAFWYVVFHDCDGTEIARLDANRPELHELLKRPGDSVVLERQVRSHRPPVRWTIQPTDCRRNWLPRVSGTITPPLAP